MADSSTTQGKNKDTGLVIRTTNIDFFLNCDQMPIDELFKQSTKDEKEEEEEPAWEDVKPDS
jgi:hypothetical protein